MKEKLQVEAIKRNIFSRFAEIIGILLFYSLCFIWGFVYP